MGKYRLTRRGKIVFSILILVIIIGIWSIASSMMDKMDKASDVLGSSEQTSVENKDEGAGGSNISTDAVASESDSEDATLKDDDGIDELSEEVSSTNSNETLDDSSNGTEEAEANDTEIIQLNEDLRKSYTIYFEPDKYDLKSDYVDILDMVFDLSMETDSIIVIEGNYNGTKNNKPEMFLSLSMNRALVAKTYLINKGIDQNRIEIVNNGASKPLSTDMTDKEIMKNRRVDMFFKDYYK